MPRQAQPAPFDGALVIDKPKGKTSHDVVDAVRHLAGFRQIGHLGTLDPLATGVLVLLLGRATRLVQFYSGRRKRYEAGFRFGFATDTYGSDGEAQGPDAAPELDTAILEQFACERIGRFEQMPPSFSAKKVKGGPAYGLRGRRKAGGRGQEIQHQVGAGSAGPRRASAGSDDPTRWRRAEAATAAGIQPAG